MNYTQNSTAPFQILSVAVVNALQGFAIGGSNLLIVLSVVRYDALRNEKEYILVMALALADTIAMSPYVFSGLYRIMEYLRESDPDSPRMPFECLLLPHKLLWLFSDHLQSFSLLLVSCDRLYLVAFPLSYLAQSKIYMWRAVKLFYSIAFSIGLAGVVEILSQPQVPSLTAGCFIYRLLHPVHLFYHRNGPFMVALASVLVYLAVLPTYKYRLLKVATTNRLIRQQKMTKTLAISCLCTFCLYCIPFKLAYKLLDANCYNAAMAMFVVVNCNSLANMLIYSVRHYEIRTAIKGVLRGKILPQNLAMWPPAPTPVESVSLAQFS